MGTIFHTNSFLIQKRYDSSFVLPKRAVFQTPPKGPEKVTASPEAKKSKISDDDYKEQYEGSILYLQTFVDGSIFKNEAYKDIPAEKKQALQEAAQKAITEIKNLYDLETIKALRDSDQLKEENYAKINDIFGKYPVLIGNEPAPTQQVETKKELTSAESLVLSEARRPFDELVKKIEDEIGTYTKNGALDISAFAQITAPIEQLKIDVNNAKDAQKIATAFDTLKNVSKEFPVSKLAEAGYDVRVVYDILGGIADRISSTDEASKVETYANEALNAQAMTSRLANIKPGQPFDRFFGTLHFQAIKNQDGSWTATLINKDQYNEQVKAEIARKKEKTGANQVVAIRDDGTAVTREDLEKQNRKIN